jgi:hypothetical protein
MATTKREPVKPTGPGPKTKRSAPRLLPAHPNELTSNTRAGREAAHQSQSRHTAK